MQQIYSGNGLPNFIRIVRVLYKLLRKTFWSLFLWTHCIRVYTKSCGLHKARTQQAYMWSTEASASADLDIADIIDQAYEKLFQLVLTNPNHVLSSLLPDKTDQHYLTARRHFRQLLLSVQCNSWHWTDIKSLECLSVCVCVCVRKTFRPR